MRASAAADGCLHLMDTSTDSEHAGLYLCTFFCLVWSCKLSVHCCNAGKAESKEAILADESDATMDDSIPHVPPRSSGGFSALTVSSVLSFHLLAEILLEDMDLSSDSEMKDG